MKQITRLILLCALLCCAKLLVGAYYPPTGTIIDASTYPIVGDGLTNNNTALARIFSDANNAPYGAKVVFPCGVYKYTTTQTITIPANFGFQLQGAGQSCTTFYKSGAGNGFNATLGNLYSTFKFADFSVTTDATSGQALNISEPAGLNNQYGPTNEIDNVGFLGQDFYGAQTQYWTYGVQIAGVSNVNINGGVCNGIPALPGAHHTICYYAVGGGSGANPYSVVFNFNQTQMNQCATAFRYGDWIQGAVLSVVNVTGCDNGITTTAGGGSFVTDILDQLTVSDSQFNTYVCGICINDPYFSDALIYDSLFIVENGSIGIKLTGTNYVVANNQMGDIGNGTSTAIQFSQSSAGFGGLVEGNFIGGFLSMVGVNASVNTQARIRHNMWFSGSGPTSAIVGGNVNNQTASIVGYVRAAGSRFLFTPGATNTGAMTFNDGSGAVPIYAGGTTPVSANAVVMGVAALLTYSAANSGYELSVPQEYTIDPSSSSTIIDDEEPKNFAYAPACGTAIRYSKFFISDANSPTYNAAVSGGGANLVPTICTGSFLAAH